MKGSDEESQLASVWQVQSRVPRHVARSPTQGGASASVGGADTRALGAAPFSPHLRGSRSSETRARTGFFLSQRLLQLQSAEAMAAITYIGLVAALIACTPLTAAFAPPVSLSGWRVARTGR